MSKGSIGPGVDLYWVPLGSGGHIVRWSGKAYEAMKAFTERRERRSLYHSALIVSTADTRHVIEVTPIPRRGDDDRGEVAGGAVASRWLEPLRLFRYEVRRWRGGELAHVADPGTIEVRVSDDPAVAERILTALPCVLTPVWGRDELQTGDMWNSNSVISWVLATAGVDVIAIPLPERGRAPGWDAGVIVARRAERRERLVTG
jgi:hypothetical protein